MEPSDKKRDTLPSKKFVMLLYIPLLVPAAVPLYLAVDQEEPFIVAILIGTTVALLLANALLLVILYRWFASQTR